MNRQQQQRFFNIGIILSCVIVFTSLLEGCASTPSNPPNPNDPWQGWNRGAQAFNDKLDKAVLKPVAKGYQWITPKPVEESITNFFSNINDIGVTINDFMQFKFLQGSKDFSRFMVNTTAGVAGFFDVAKKIDLPKHNEDFGQTLGYWGIPSGNYLVLPFFGPSSPREATGLLGDALMNPMTYTGFMGTAAAAATAGARVVDITDTRANLLSTEKIVDEASVDRYEFIKNSYRQRREYLIHDGNVPDIDNDIDGDGTGGGGSGGGAGAAGKAPVVDNSASMPADQTYGPAPVTNGSTSIPGINKPAPADNTNKSGHLLNLSPPDNQ